MKTFEEEKVHYALEGSEYGSAWMCMKPKSRSGFGIDDDILPVIALINTLPCTFSIGMSCSGSTADHYNNPNPALNERFGINICKPQGYLVIRADTKSDYWQTVQTSLENIEHSTLTPRKEWERDDFTELESTDGREIYSYQIFTGEDKISPKEISKNWREIANNLVDIIQNTGRI